jgi:2-dehydro-3-deoxyphosphogluconate aldolase/(4S)-4-hydroxy-2-oxoglutarate aldolase
MSKETINGVDFSSGLIAIIRSKSTDEGREYAQAFVDTGVELIEFTTTTPGAFNLIEEFSGIKNVQIALGTAMSKQDVENGKKAGAKIVISPHTSEEVIKATKNAGLISVPGVATPTEIADALAYGADILKFFPASSLGISFLKSVRDPFPGNTWMATGGIALADVDAWVKAGITGFGLGGPLTSGGVSEIAQRVNEFQKAILQSKNSKRYI